MFLDAGAEEIMVVAVAALIFVGPKDLPVVLRKVGQFTAKMRGLAAEFRASFDEMARQSELEELRKEVEALRTGHYTAPVSAEVDKAFYDYDQTPKDFPSPAEPSPAPSALPPVEEAAAAPLPSAAKPRAKKAAPSAEAAAAPKPRKPRAKAVPAPEPKA